MNKREFERELFLAIEGYFGNALWKDKRGRNYNWVMDDLAQNCSDEQWLIVDLTLDSIHYPNFITGEVSCDTPVSPNQWVEDSKSPLDTPVTGYQKPAPLGWWFCIEDMIPQQMTADEAMNYTGPFATEREAWIAELIQMDERIDNLVAELDMLRRKQ